MNQRILSLDEEYYLSHKINFVNFTPTHNKDFVFMILLYKSKSEQSSNLLFPLL